MIGRGDSSLNTAKNSLTSDLLCLQLRLRRQIALIKVVQTLQPFYLIVRIQKFHQQFLCLRAKGILDPLLIGYVDTEAFVTFRGKEQLPLVKGLGGLKKFFYVFIPFWSSVSL